jgi:hypothetical protein
VLQEFSKELVAPAARERDRRQLDLERRPARHAVLACERVLHVAETGRFGRAGVGLT